MNFDHLLLVFIYTFVVPSAATRRLKVHRLPSGIDEFEVLDDNMDSICTETERAMEFCARHGAINVKNTGPCSNHDEETLQCRCNSTKSTFLLHEGRCVNNRNITRLLHGEVSPGRRFTEFLYHTYIPYCFMKVIIYFIIFIIIFVGSIII